MAKRPPLLLDDLTFIDAEELRNDAKQVPDKPGVYLWFVRGGKRLLELTHYYDTDTRDPLSYLNRAHLYTGASRDLRFRLSQHLRNEIVNQSSPRKSLIAIERIFGAVGQAVPSHFDVEEDGGLTDWIFENVVFGYRLHASPLGYETQILNAVPSPFNIVHRRQHRYAKYLMAWRAIAFPSDWMEGIPFGKFESGRISEARVKRMKCLTSALLVK